MATMLLMAVIWLLSPDEKATGCHQPQVSLWLCPCAWKISLAKVYQDSELQWSNVRAIWEGLSLITCSFAHIRGCIMILKHRQFFIIVYIGWRRNRAEKRQENETEWSKRGRWIINENICVLTPVTIGNFLMDLTRLSNICVLIDLEATFLF